MRRGFTLIEITTVVLIIALLASIIVPNLARMQEAREARLASVRLADLARQAKLEASRLGGVVTLRYLSGENAFVLEQQSLGLTPDAPTTGLTLQEEPTDQAREVARAQLPPSMRVDVLRRNGEVLDEDSWSLRFFDDGANDEGGFELDDDGTIRSLWVPRNGEPEWREEPLPEPTEAEWEAGELEQRTE